MNIHTLYTKPVLWTYNQLVQAIVNSVCIYLKTEYIMYLYYA